MQKILTAEEMREVDRLTTERYGIPSIMLMENAAHAAAHVIFRNLGDELTTNNFLIVCGKGNNGGDGAALARILWSRCAKCRVLLIGSVNETQGDARANFEILQKLSAAKETNLPYEKKLEFEETDAIRCAEMIEKADGEVLVDAVFGTGLTRPVEGAYEKLFSTIARRIDKDAFRLIVALDLPSGLSSDSSEIAGPHIPADVTISFTRPKLANVFTPASEVNGDLYVAHIGSPAELVDETASRLFLADATDALSFLSKTGFEIDSYKNRRGHAVVVAGSNTFPGAAVLAGNAAMFTGTGLTTILTSISANHSVAPRVLPEVMTRGFVETSGGALSIGAFDEISAFTAKADAVLIGSGLSSDEEETKELVRKLVAARTTPVVLDADGLNALAPFTIGGDSERPLILTPHEGEFKRLLGTDSSFEIKDRVELVREFATKHNVILVLKGERVLIGGPDGRVVVNPTGNSGVGKAGNGDTLAGLLTGFLAQAAQMKVDIFESVVAAVYLAGLAADYSEKEFDKRTMLASDVRNSLRDAIREVERS